MTEQEQREVAAFWMNVFLTATVDGTKKCQNHNIKFFVAAVFVENYN